MTIIEKKPNNKTKKTEKSKNPFKRVWNGVPATKRRTIGEISLYESFAASLFWHIMVVIFICVVSLLFAFFGITPRLFPKPQNVKKDIEFTINNPRQRIRHISPQPATGSNGSSGMESNKPKASTENKPKDSVSQLDNISNNFKNTFFGKSKSTSAAGKHASKSSFSQAASKSKSGVPDFGMPSSGLKSMTSGLGGSGKGKHHASGVESSGSAFGGGNGTSSAGNGSSGHSGFDKNATKKIITTYDISPYVNELKRNIRWNWKAPKDNGKRVELFLRIAKDGRVVILNVKKTSEVGEVDNAALNAVRKAMPLNPLPAKYAKGYLDVIFMFDSNSIGSRY